MELHVPNNKNLYPLIDSGVAEALASRVQSGLAEGKTEAEIKDQIEHEAGLTKSGYIEDHKVELSDNDLTMFPKPKSGCKYCYGRGIENWNSTTGEPNMCRCIMNQFGRTFEEDKMMTLGEYKALTNNKISTNKGVKPLSKRKLIRAGLRKKKFSENIGA